jgi:hypothetical protein
MVMSPSDSRKSVRVGWEVRRRSGTRPELGRTGGVHSSGPAGRLSASGLEPTRAERQV